MNASRRTDPSTTTALGAVVGNAGTEVIAPGKTLMSDNPKAMARVLREQLRTRGLDLGHGECLDLVAKQLGHRDWNVLAARPSGPELVRVHRAAEWVARNDDAELGRLTATRRPNRRWFVSCDAWDDATHATLLAAAADELRADLYVTVDEADSESLTRYLAAGFHELRREDEVKIDVPGALTALAGAHLPSGYTVVSAADVDRTLLRLLDDELRADVPGSEGWVNDPQEFREYTFAMGHFDRTAYLVALDEAGAGAGLARIWRGRMHRLGLIGVARPHRRQGVARGLLRAAFEAVHAQGVATVVAETDVTNTASQTLLDSLGARRTGGTVELRRLA